MDTVPTDTLKNEHCIGWIGEQRMMTWWQNRDETNVNNDQLQYDAEADANADDK